MEKRFIAATTEACSFARHIPAPYLRRSFSLERLPKTATVSICVSGFYRLWINGTEITKGYFAPYIANPDHYLYEDRYDLLSHLRQGENVIGVLLGNGFQNPFGGAVWRFDRAPWIGAPRMALDFLAEGAGERLSFSADERFLTHPSPILFDEYRMGEIYDARAELCGWDQPGYDASGWTPAIAVEPPHGAVRTCQAELIRCYETLTPISVTPHEGGYLYDFGKNTAGICRLRLRNAAPGQTVVIWLCECLNEGRFDRSNLYNSPERFPFYETDLQRLEYRARGGETEDYAPSFAWFGYRYAWVTGITAEQATKELLSYPVLSSALPRIGEFSCSDETVMRIARMVENADRSNFYYFPTDCPHREKNGWTCDAALSAPQMTLLFDTTNSYTEWLRGIVAAQRADGSLPGIVPTAGWGYGFGPLWDSALIRLPYVLWRFRGETEPMRLCADAMLRYLGYARDKRNADGMVSFGVGGDWAPVGRSHNGFTTPREVTASIFLTELAREAAEMLSALGRGADAAFAEDFSRALREAVRRELVDHETLTVRGETQTAQALALYYGIFEPQEEQAAFAVLERLIEQNGGSFDCGVVGLYAMLHVLSHFGRGEVAWRMVTQREFPSYRNLLDRGETALVESFQPEGSRFQDDSHNHHFFGDVLRWFFFELAGLQICDSKRVRICPSFLGALDRASASYRLPSGKVSVEWKRTDGGILLTVSHPSAVRCEILCDRAEVTIKERVLS